MKYDDKIRSKFGLAVCLRDMGNGTSRLFFDDIEADKEDPINWKHDHFYTFTPEFDNNAIDEMNLTGAQFQYIGETVVARLLALNGKIK